MGICGLSFCHIFINYVTDLTRAPVMVTSFLSLLTLLAETSATLLQLAPIADNHGSNVITIWNRVTLPVAPAEVRTMALTSDVWKVNTP
jgi:hypothetical protein